MLVGVVADTCNLVLFSKEHCFILNQIDHSIIVVGHRAPGNGLYSFGGTFESHLAENSDITNLWHMRYDHLSYQNLSHLAKADRVLGLPKLDTHYKVSEHCLAGHQYRERFPRHSTTRATKPGERLHSDLMGPLNASLGGSRYVLVFTDDFSMKSWTFFLKSKSETFGRFRSLKAQIEAKTDSGGEYLSSEFTTYYTEHDIKRELTEALTLQHNGVSERRNCTLMERSRSMSSACKLPSFL
jgi:hypothetical protein